MPVSAFHSNRAIIKGMIMEATIIVEDGLILEVVEGRSSYAGASYVEAGDNILMAGIIDPHVHLNEPGRTEWEGFETGTKAAIAGGITSLVEMPLNASPVTTTTLAFDEKLAAASGKLYANCGFWGGIVPGNAKEIIPLAKKGILGFKAFLTHSGIDEFPNVSEEDLNIAMPLVAETGLPLLVHCELSDPSADTEKHSSRSYQQYLASRPGVWEDAAISMMIRLCEKHGCRVHIVHLSSATAIASIKAAKAKGLPLSVETAQHYLYFNAEEIEDGNTSFKCAPPIRELANNEQLWKALKEGTIDFVATDHSPAPPALKEIKSGDFMKAWGGISSLQLSLPILWTAAKKHGCQVVDISKWLCEKPAILAGLQHRKGKLEKGFDADFVIWDPGRNFIVDGNALQHKHKLTPYHGQPLFGVVHETYVSGKKIFGNGYFTGVRNGEVIYRDYS